MKKTTEQIDNEILDHAEKIIKLMKLKGLKEGVAEYGLEQIQINLWENSVDVMCITQRVETIRRKKNK